MRLSFHAILYAGILMAHSVSGQEAAKRISGSPSGEEAPLPQSPPAAPPAWEFEVFGRGGAAGLSARGEVSFGVEIPDPNFALSDTERFPDLTTSARSANWGAGLRARRGRWGLEGQYHRVDTSVFLPTALIRETSIEGSGDIPLLEAATDLVAVLGVLEFPFRSGPSGFFVGLGAGYAVMGNREASRVPMGDSGTGFSDETFGDAENVLLSASLSPRDYHADRGSLLVGGTAGLTLRTGRLFLRPRLDVFLGGTRTTEESWDFDIGVSAPGQRFDFAGVVALETAVRPRFFLFSVDVGLSFGR